MLATDDSLTSALRTVSPAAASSGSARGPAWPGYETPSSPSAACREPGPDGCGSRVHTTPESFATSTAAWHPAGDPSRAASCGCRRSRRRCQPAPAIVAADAADPGVCGAAGDDGGPGHFAALMVRDLLRRTGSGSPSMSTAWLSPRYVRSTPTSSRLTWLWRWSASRRARLRTHHAGHDSNPANGIGEGGTLKAGPMRLKPLLGALAVTLALASALAGCQDVSGPAADGPLSSGSSRYGPVPTGGICVPGGRRQTFGVQIFTCAQKT